MELTLTRREISLLLNALDLIIDAEWMRPEKQGEYEQLQSQIESQCADKALS